MYSILFWPNYWSHAQQNNCFNNSLAQEQYNIAMMNSHPNLLWAYNNAMQNHRPRYKIKPIVIDEWQKGMFDKQSEWEKIP